MPEVKLEKVRNCDFCNNPDAFYIWKFRSQIIPEGCPLDILPALIENPEWFACESCHNHLLNRSLTGLLDNADYQFNTEQKRKFFARLYQSLIQNLEMN